MGPEEGPVLGLTAHVADVPKGHLAATCDRGRWVLRCEKGNGEPLGWTPPAPPPRRRGPVRLNKGPAGEGEGEGCGGPWRGEERTPHTSEEVVPDEAPGVEPHEVPVRDVLGDNPSPPSPGGGGVPPKGRGSSFSQFTFKKEKNMAVSLLTYASDFGCVLGEKTDCERKTHKNGFRQNFNCTESCFRRQHEKLDQKKF